MISDHIIIFRWNIAIYPCRNVNGLNEVDIYKQFIPLQNAGTV